MTNALTTYILWKVARSREQRLIKELNIPNELYAFWGGFVKVERTKGKDFMHSVSRLQYRGPIEILKWLTKETKPDLVDVMCVGFFRDPQGTITRERAFTLADLYIKNSIFNTYDSYQ